MTAYLSIGANAEEGAEPIDFDTAADNIIQKIWDKYYDSTNGRREPDQFVFAEFQKFLGDTSPGFVHADSAEDADEDLIYS